jgi:hypothetical protein
MVAALSFAGLASPLFAQVQLVPAIVPKWDAGVQFGWSTTALPGADPPDRAFHPRYNAATLSASATTLLTRHVRVGFGADYAGDGTQYSNSLVVLPGFATPQYVFRQHRYQETAFNAFVGYQFFENRWVHPSLAFGAQAFREVHRVTNQSPSSRGGSITTTLPVERTVRVCPFADAAVKFYVAERAFIRSSVQVGVSSGSPRFTWTTGLGFDF